MQELPSQQVALVMFIVAFRFERQNFYLLPIALFNACNNAVSSNGLNKHSAAPSSSNCDRATSSLRAVMKTTGILTSRLRSSRKSSGPVITGIATSSIRQLECKTASDARKSFAEENVRAANPNSFNNSGKDSRNDWSSSTTETSNRVFIKTLSHRN